MSRYEASLKSISEITESRYGSDKHGLVWGYHFIPGQAAQEINSENLTELLSGLTTPVGKANEKSPDSFIWLHFSLSNANSETWIRQNLNLPEAFHESLHEGAGSTRLEQDGSSLVAVIHDVLFDFTFDAAGVSTVILCLEPRLLISARLKPLRSVDRLRASVKTGQAFRSSAELFAHLLRDQSGVLVDIIRQSTQRVDTIEDKLLENKVATSRRDLGSLRRVLVRLQRLLAPEPAALFRLLSRPPSWIANEDLQDLREAAEEFSTAAADSAALVERVKLLQEELAAQVNEQTHRT